LIGLDVALDRLLHCRAYREDFLAGRLEALDLSGEDLEALATVDRATLVREAEAVLRDLLQRHHRGSGDLLALYPRTVDAWRAAHPDDPELVELISRFAESAAFAEYREIPFAGPGRCLEEAFHRFSEAEAIGDPGAREDEFLTAMMKALLLSPTPSFTLPAEIRTSAGGFYALGRRGDPRLYAVTSGRLVTGTLTPFLAELLDSADPPAEIAVRHGMTPAIRDASLAHLTALGLLPRITSVPCGS
jgi:hypothetical protein